MRDWADICAYAKQIEQRFPVGCVVVDLDTRNRWEVVGHLLEHLKVVPLWRSPTGRAWSRSVCCLLAAGVEKENLHE